MIRYFFFGIFLISGINLAGKQVPDRPVPPRLVNDFAGLLQPGQANALEQKLVAYDDSTSIQIAIVIEESLEGDDPFDYSLRLVEKWGVGQEQEDNGILIFAFLLHICAETFARFRGRARR